MFRGLTISALAVLLGGAPAEAPKAPAKGLPVSSVGAVASINDLYYDADAERELLDLANQARAQSGLSPLKEDDGLRVAAREHAAAMARAQQLSHQFSGEPGLSQRLAASSTLHLDHAGENVAFAGTAAQAEENLMHSPPHRQNLLNPVYNVAGFAAVRGGYSLYVVQDFGRGSSTYSPKQAAESAAQSVAHARLAARLASLRRNDDTAVQSAACTMAQSDSLKAALPNARYVLRYTTMQPETVPAGAAKAIGDRDVHSFSIGTCYARTSSYPNGAYWVALILF